MSDIMRQALKLSALTQTRLDNMGEDNEGNDDVSMVNVDLTSGGGLPQEIDEMGQNDPVRLAYFREKKKEVYLNTLLKSLNDCFRKVKAQHGAV